MSGGENEESMKKVKMLQFIGTQRSGSNLLRLMLDAHSQISAPHPPHLLRNFYSLLSHYGDLTKHVNRKLLVEDMCNWVEANPVPWEDVVLDRDKITTQAKTVFDVFRLIYETRMRVDRARIWCCKSTFNLNYAVELDEHIEPFYIYLYRDGRDVATSFKKTIVGPKHTYHLARKWSAEQKHVSQFLDGLPENRYMAIAYEYLLSNPEKLIKNLCDKIGIVFEAGMLRFYESRESQLTADSGQMWKNVLRPVMPYNTGKYLSELDQEDILLFESVAGEELQSLGYTLESDQPINYEANIEDYDREEIQLQADARARASREDIVKRARQQNLIAKIHERFGLGTLQLSPA